MNTEHSFTALVAQGEAHLMQVEPRFEALIARHGSCSLVPDADLFRCAVRSVVAQLISTAAARTISGRVESLVKNQITPARLAKLSDEELRACGLSRAKVKTIRGLIEHFQANRGLSAKLAQAPDHEVRASLLSLHGIGPWTVDMLLIFSLGRTDVWPVGDLGLRAAVQELFRMKALPDAARLTKLSRKWQPYRTIATWHLWRSRDAKAKSGENK
jgi:DNA-3-methyladenine glycosylase II